MRNRPIPGQAPCRRHASRPTSATQAGLVLLLLVLGACAGAQPQQDTASAGSLAVQPATPTDAGTTRAAVPTGRSAAGAGPLRWRAVVVAGDDSLPVWQNAARRMYEGLAAGGAAQVVGYSAMVQGPQAATLGNVLNGIASLRPGPGEGCLVFATAHGGQGTGLYLTPRKEVLTPADLARALDAGCGQAPTVAILSGCFTGHFTQGALAAPNRVVLTAARADRPSFGCGAGFTYTVFDECLLGALGGASDWRDAQSRTTSCVTARERQMNERPSEPQLHNPSLAQRLPTGFRAAAR